MNDDRKKLISEKTRQSLQRKRENGEYVSPFVPYGYRRDSKNKNQIQIDWSAAKIVKIIFQYKLSGLSNHAIKNKLNDMEILSPFEYKKGKGYPVNDYFKKNEVSLWHEQTINTILKNPIYTGCLTQGTTSIVMKEGKRTVQRTKNTGIMIENHHEAIIDKVLFRAVNQLMLMDTRVKPQGERIYLFSGFLICGDCGQNMIRSRKVVKGKEYIYYICSSYKNKRKCKSHRIREEKIKDFVNKSLNERFLELEALSDRLQGQKESFDINLDWLDLLIEYSAIEELTRQVLAVLVDYIEVLEESIQIHYTHESEVLYLKKKLRKKERGEEKVGSDIKKKDTF